MLKVTFIIIARNSEKSIVKALGDLRNQSYSKNLIEVILVDGSSADRTRSIMEQFSQEYKDCFAKVAVLDNEKRILASGWNIALATSTGAVILRIDAHARIPEDFIAKNVDLILKGENIVGGQTMAMLSPGGISGLVSLAEKSKFGAGSAPYRNAGIARYVDTLAHAAYKRNVFIEVGGYDERLDRNQDIEIHYRMKVKGFKFYYSPEIKSQYKVKTDLIVNLEQKFFNGVWIGLMMGIQPGCVSLRHLIPLFFIIALVATFLIGIVYSWLLFFILLYAYFFTAISFSCKSVFAQPIKTKLLGILLPSFFFLIHVFYGLGTFIGLIRVPIFLWRNKRYKVSFPIQTEL